MGVDGGREHAVIAIAHGYGIAVFGFEGVVGTEVDVQQVDAEADGGNQIDDGAFTEELSAEHPVDAVREPFDIVKIVAAAVFARRFFGNLGGHEVDVEPGQELVVLRTDFHVQTEIVIVEMLVLGNRTVLFKNGDGRGVVFDLICF